MPFLECQNSFDENNWCTRLRIAHDGKLIDMVLADLASKAEPGGGWWPSFECCAEQ